MTKQIRVLSELTSADCGGLVDPTIGMTTGVIGSLSVLKR